MTDSDDYAESQQSERGNPPKGKWPSATFPRSIALDKSDILGQHRTRSVTTASAVQAPLTHRDITNRNRKEVITMGLKDPASNPKEAAKEGKGQDQNVKGGKGR